MSRTSIPLAIRLRVAEQARHRCGYCLTTEVIIGAPMQIEHIVPIALGGSDEEENLWLACPLCNASKGDRVAGLDRLTGSRERIFDPRRQSWHEPRLDLLFENIN